MNERIRELAGQAGFETEHHKWIFANDNAGEGECHELLDKFAELIIKECASLFPLTFTDEQYQRRIDKTIRKHFGLDQ
jgi:hypothetical protein